MSIWLSGKSYLVTECTNEVPLIAVFTDYCPDLLPNVLAGSPLLQQTKGKSYVQSFLSPTCSPNNVDVFFRNSTIFQGFFPSATCPLASGCTFHFLQCLRLGSEGIQRAKCGREISAGHLQNFQVLGKGCLMNIELAPLHTSVF